MDRTKVQAAGSYIFDSEILRSGLAAGRVGVWRWRVDSNVLEWSENLEAVHGLAKGTFDGTLTTFQNDINPDDAERVWKAIQDAIKTNEPYRVVYRTNTSSDDEPIWIEASGGMVSAPDGARYLTGVCMDVTTRCAAERELERRLRQQKAVERLGIFAFEESEFQAILDEAVRVAAEVLVVPLTKILMFSGTADSLYLTAGIGWREGLVGKASVGIGRESQAGYTLLAGQPVIVHDLKTETRFSGPQLLHEHGVRSGMSVTIPGTSTRPVGVFGVHDTKLRKFTEGDAEFLLSLATIVANAVRHCEANEHRQLLVREMSHRAGNMLQLVSTLANQTFSGDTDIAQARRAFSERLGSLSRANYLVAHGGWTSTRVQELFEETLQPFQGMVEMEGRDVLLPPDLCFDLALVVHELATNSAKYGSLSHEGGRVALGWGAERETRKAAKFSFVWRDERNIEATRTSPHTGFGSRLLSALVEKKWGGAINIDRSAGYCFSAMIPFTPE